jgi:fibronectin-binding autotransporter adhesin
MKSPFKSTFLSLIVIGSTAIAQADTYNWNGSSTGGATGVSNTWDTTTANWTGTGTIWPSTGSDNDAVFAGTAGTVDIPGTVTANDISLSVTAYKLGADASPGIIILNGTNPTITTPASGGGSIDVGAKIQGSAGLIKSGSVTLQLRNANTYTGSTEIIGGTLLIGAANNRLPTTTNLILGNGVTNASGVFQMNSRSQQVGGLETSGTGTGNRVINGSTAITTFTVSNASDQTFGGILGGTGANHNNFNFTKSAAGRLILTSSNSFTGTATVSGGTLELGHATNTLADAVPINVNGGTLDIADKTETVGALTVTSGSITGTTGVLTASSCAGKSGTVSGILASSSNLSGTNTTWLTKDTAGNLELSAANTFTGNISSTAGRITLAHSQALGIADPNPEGTNRKGIISQGSSRSIWLKGGITIPSNIDFWVSSNSGDGGGINNESGDNEIQSQINFSNGNSALNIASASGKLIISGNLTMTSTARTLHLGGVSETENTISGDITESTTAIMPIIKQGVGKWILSGTNTYKGDTTVNGGTLVLANGGSTRFIPQEDASSNKITGNTNGTLTLDGAFDIDLTAAATAPDSTSWLLVDVNNVEETFDTHFTVTSFTESPAGTWSKTDGGNTYTFTENDGLLVKTAAAPTNTYANWLTTNAPATGFTTDSDNDGVANAVEHILGTNPNSPSTSLTEVSSTGSTTTYKHTLNPTIASDVNYSYEWTTDLTEWKASGESNTTGTTANITATPPAVGVVTVTTSVSSGPAAKLFTRIKVSNP